VRVCKHTASRHCHIASAHNSSRLAKRDVVADTQTMETIPAHDQLTDPAIVTPPVAAAASGDYDSPWKEAIEQYFPAFIAFFFPDIHTDIAWDRGYEFLDKELERIVRDAPIGRRYADKLVKVFLVDGVETWLLIHIEIQSSPDPAFPQRMFVYNYRIFDRYEVDVVSLAVCTGAMPAAHVAPYRKARWGCELTFRFPVVQLQEFGRDWHALEQHANPFAVVVMAHLKAQETRDGAERKQWKLRLMRGLYERGCTRAEIMTLFRFIDWLLVLPAALEQEFWDELHQFEEEKRMPYVTSVERLGMQKGFEQGLQQGLQQGQLQTAREMLLEGSSKAVWRSARRRPGSRATPRDHRASACAPTAGAHLCQHQGVQRSLEHRLEMRYGHRLT
jgi:hypothetical protein